MHAWFLEITFVGYVSVFCVRVSPSPRLLITSGVMWTPYDWLNKLYSFCMVAIVSIIGRRGIKIEAYHRSQPNKGKVALYNLLI